MKMKWSRVVGTRISFPVPRPICRIVAARSVCRVAALLLAAVLATTPAAAGVHAIFADGFESGQTTKWGQPVRCVVFEGFYNPG
jgi:hypothetical protein